MLRFVKTTDTDLLEHYRMWIESVYAAKRFLTKQLVIDFETAIDSYTSDNNVKVKLLEIGKVTGYNQFEWVKNKYETTQVMNISNKAVKLSSTEHKVSSGVNTDVAF